MCNGGFKTFIKKPLESPARISFVVVFLNREPIKKGQQGWTAQRERPWVVVGEWWGEVQVEEE